MKTPNRMGRQEIRKRNTMSVDVDDKNLYLSSHRLKVLTRRTRKQKHWKKCAWRGLGGGKNYGFWFFYFFPSEA